MSNKTIVFESIPEIDIQDSGASVQLHFSASKDLSFTISSYDETIIGVGWDKQAIEPSIHAEIKELIAEYPAARKRTGGKAKKIRVTIEVIE